LEQQNPEVMSEPYAFITTARQSLSSYRDSLLMNGTAREKFDQLNEHLQGSWVVMPGQLIIVGDGSTRMCTTQERLLMSYARDVRQALFANDEASAYLIAHRYDLLQNMMSYGSIGIGSTTSAWSDHLKEVEKTLKSINAAYQHWRSGAITKGQFLARRQELFGILDGQLRGIGRLGTGFQKSSSIKKMLGIYSKRYLRTGEIPNYARNVKRISNLARYLGAGTLIGVTLDIGAGALEITEACSTGRGEECTKAKFVEAGKVMLGIPAAGGAGKFAGPAAARLCLRMAVPSRGASVIVCGIAAGAAAGWAGGQAGSWGGEGIGTMLYEMLDE